MAMAPATRAPVVLNEKLHRLPCPRFDAVLDRGQRDRDHQDRAIGDLQDEGRDVEERQRALDQEDVDGADRGADQPAAPAGEADAAERHRRDRDQRVGRRDVGVGRADQGGQHQAGDAGEKTPVMT